MSDCAGKFVQLHGLWHIELCAMLAFSIAHRPYASGSAHGLSVAQAVVHCIHL